MTFIFPRGHISGLTLSTAGSSSSFGISAGQCTDDAASVIMNAASAFTKTTSGWSEGTGNGALLDVGSIANNTWYHAFAMERLDTLGVDYGVSTSLSPSLPTNYTTSRRLGSMLTDGSGHWTKFLQFNDLFLWDSPPVEFSTISGSNGANLTRTFQLPRGVRVRGKFSIFFNTSATMAGTYWCPDLTSGASAISIFGSGFASAQIEVLTNTSAQVMCSESSAQTLTMRSFGWYDDRGKAA